MHFDKVLALFSNAVWKPLKWLLGELQNDPLIPHIGSWEGGGDGINEILGYKQRYVMTCLPKWDRCILYGFSAQLMCTETISIPELLKGTKALRSSVLRVSAAPSILR